ASTHGVSTMTRWCGPPMAGALRDAASPRCASRHSGSNQPREQSVTFATKYGPWALVAGASDGVGAAFAAGLAERGVNVVLLARRQGVLDQVAAEIESRTSAQTRTLAVDLAAPNAASVVAATTSDLEIGFLVYCAGADPNYEPFLDNSVEAAEAMGHRNC